MWLLLKLHQQATVSVLGNNIDVPYKDMAKGCVGVLLVFDNEENIVEYAEDGDSILRLELKESGGEG